MIELLEATKKYINFFKGIRVSTRPDFINDEILSLLLRYNVTSIELGAQSMCNTVLAANNRGHTNTDVINASQLIKNYGFSLGLQMMTGLYKSNNKEDLNTGKEFIKLKPDTVRIYPTVVVKNTKLAELYQNNIYIPPKLKNSISLCAKLLDMFNKENIKVIKLGLHSSKDLEKDILAGSYHPAFRELCESELLYNKILNDIEINNFKSGNIDIYVNSKSISKAVGQNKANIIKLKKIDYNPKIKTDNNLSKYEVKVEQR